MDRFVKGFEIYFAAARDYSPRDFMNFRQLWSSDDVSLIGYTGEDFKLYLGFSQGVFSNDVNLFLFNPMKVSEYVVNAVDERVYGISSDVSLAGLELNFEEFRCKHPRMFKPNFFLNGRRSEFLAEKIALALGEVGEPEFRMKNELVYSTSLGEVPNIPMNIPRTVQ